MRDRRITCAPRPFLIADGVTAVERGQAYVLRRDHARRYAGSADGAERRSLCAPPMLGPGSRARPTRATARELIEETFSSRRTRFRETFERGLTLLRRGGQERLKPQQALPGRGAGLQATR